MIPKLKLGIPPLRLATHKLSFGDAKLKLSVPGLGFVELCVHKPNVPKRKRRVPNLRLGVFKLRRGVANLTRRVPQAWLGVRKLRSGSPNVGLWSMNVGLRSPRAQDWGVQW